jgi:hypothetical protein
MKEILDRINQKYLKCERGFDERFDYAMYLFLNIAYMSEERQDLPDTVRDVQKALAEAVEEAFYVVEQYHSNAMKRECYNPFGGLDELRERVEEKYRFASECVDFGNIKNSHFRAAAQNVIGIVLAKGKVHINADGAGRVRDVFKTYRAIVKSL